MLLLVLRNVNAPRRCWDTVPITLFASPTGSAAITCTVTLTIIINIQTFYGFLSPVYVVPSRSGVPLMPVVRSVSCSYICGVGRGLKFDLS